MRNFMIILLLATSTLTSAQVSGEVTYITKVDMHRDLPDDERGERMRSFMPEFIEFNNILLFTMEETVYKTVPNEEVILDMDQQQKRQQRMMKRMSPVNDIIYCNVTKGLIVEKKEFMDKIFLIRDTVNLSQWKLSGEQKEVSGMNCMKAEYIPNEGDSNKVEVWFTPEVPVSSGPAGYGGLPGLIVFVDVNEGKMQIAMSTMVMRDITEDEIEEPVKGKEMTREEFREMQLKKMEQQRKQWEGQGGGKGRPPHHH